MGNKISGEITPAIKTTVEGLATGAKAAMPFLRNATKKERETLPKMGLQRAGFVDKAYAGALAHTNKLPGDFDMAEFTKDAKLKVDLPYIRQIFVDMVELVDDTSLLLGNDLIM